MTLSEKDLAVEIVHAASDSVGALMLRQAEERLKALQVAAHSLDQRITQVAAFQFAAAAVVVSLADQGPLSALGALSAVCFLVGGLIAFRGIRSDPIHLPGIEPNWWKKTIEIERFEIDSAQGWAAGVYQTSITQVDIENCERGKYLNLSLRFALAGGGVIVIVAIIKVFS